MIFWLGLCFITSALVGLLAILWYQRYSNFFYHLHKIPGPKGYPLIGNVLSYFVREEEVFSNGHRIVREYAPISKVWSFVYGHVNLEHPSDIELIISGTKHNEKSLFYNFLQPWLGTGLLTSTGPKWLSRRKILTPAFHFNILQDFVNLFNDETEKLVDDIAKKCNQPSSVVNISPLVIQFTLNSIVESSMGIKLDPDKSISKEYKDAIHNFGRGVAYRIFRPWVYPWTTFLLSSTGRLARSAVKTLHNFSRNVITERKKNFNLLGYSGRKRLAMLDLLLQAQKEGFDIDNEGVREEVDTFMFEGHDTTSVAINFSLMLLANHPAVQQEVYNELVEVLGDRAPTFNDLNELVYTERVLKECLRLYPSVPLISRYASCDFKSATGYVIPKGAMVTAHIYDLHRNAEIYPDPEKFDPDRFLPEMTQKRHPFAFIPFSAGPRNCIGQKFAMLELKSVLSGILRKFILEPVTKPSDIVIMGDLVLRAKEGIRIKFKLRTTT